MISTADLEIALHEYQEWGEKLKTPRATRIAEMFPDHAHDEIQSIIAVCSEVEDFSWKIAEAVRDRGMAQSAAKNSIKERFPFMSDDNLSRALSQAMYYTLK